ncbi:HEPN domain-containing protein [Dyadobacter sp. Leaf189]|uniref:HEPN domain-containing protein n=1 Tax=Dyadobacter sp. Leaf189 TaxID=1736295 RepID=UPI0006FB823C|nr:HEPN domain-containing protein [Dyadobacter sp. Leaf189]KQS27019.1 hypothetical protein ASG33_21015 [Dyadobacter sp. Leaf189]
MQRENMITVFSSISNCKVIGTLPRIRGLLNICPANTKLKDDPRYDEDIIGRLGTMVINHLRMETFIKKTDMEKKVLNAFNLEDISHVPSIVSDFLLGYINSFWFQFDNSFMLKSVYVDSCSRKFAFNQQRGIVSTADGLSETKPITLEAFRQAESDFQVVSSWDDSKGADMDPRPEVQILTYIPVRDKFYSYNKLSRAYLLITQARMSQYVPIKLAFYVIALECLFSNDDKSEVNHKVSERASHFIGSSPEERIELFKKIKKLYDVRSKFVHGQSIKSAIKDLSLLSIEIDEILRRIFRKLIDNKGIVDTFLGNQNRLDEYYLKMIF